VLLLVTFRPEFDAPWVGRPYVTTLTINRLAEHEASAMIDRIVGNWQIDALYRTLSFRFRCSFPIVEHQRHACLYEFFDSVHRSFPLQKFTEGSRIDRRDPRWRLTTPVPTNHRAVKRHADFERPALASAATPAGPLPSTHRICLDSNAMFTLCSRGSPFRS